MEDIDEVLEERGLSKDNLSPDKKVVMYEVYRVLRPGGRHIFAKIILKGPLPEEIRKNVNDWFRCIGGALPKDDFLKCLQSAGFSDFGF